jgi:hypothetical protein
MCQQHDFDEIKTEINEQKCIIDDKYIENTNFCDKVA